MVTMSGILFYILVASGLHSTTYGYSELMCGDIGKPKKCSKGAVTASGEVFDPMLPTAAIFSPTELRMWKRATVVPVRTSGRCKFIRINDKGAPKYIGKRGFDLTPASVRLLGGRSTRYWSGTVTVCSMLLYKQLTKYEVIFWNLTE